MYFSIILLQIILYLNYLAYIIKIILFMVILMNNNDFHTFTEYMKKYNHLLTASMEDYIEMIYRLSSHCGFTRIGEISAALNVQPPSATKMIKKLRELNLLEYEKYGVIKLNENGLSLGKELLERHNTLKSFFKLLSIPENLILEETEKVEHTISNYTLKQIKKFINFMEDNKDIYNRYLQYINDKKNNEL